jgi:hypothetical protein
MLSFGPRRKHLAGDRARNHQGGVYDAIVATLIDDAAPRPPIRNAKGEYLIHLDEKTVDRLTALRRPGDSYGDVILRQAELSRKGRSRRASAGNSAGGSTETERC